MTNIDTAVLLRMIEEYGDARARIANQTNVERANELLEQIKTIVGPSAEHLAAQYRAGESLNTIARQTGLTYHAVRTAIASTNTPMRRQGRYPGTTKGRNSK